MTTVVRSKVTTADLIQVAWLRHRTLLLATAAAVAFGVALVVWAALAIPSDRDGMTQTTFDLIQSAQNVDMVFVLVMGVFWGAPLAAREYELRTNLVAWSQDVSPRRWLTGQVVLFGGLAVVFAAVVGLAAGFLEARGSERQTIFTHSPFQPDAYEAVPHVQIGYALLALAIGLAASALVRRTLFAIALAFVGVLGARVVLSWSRQYFLPPMRTFEAWSPSGVRYVQQVPNDALYVDSGYADVSGVPVDSPEVCRRAGDLTECAKANGVAGHFAEFQPVERLELFRWIETGICLALAAALLVLTWWWVGRARRV